MTTDTIAAALARALDLERARSATALTIPHADMPACFLLHDGPVAALQRAALLDDAAVDAACTTGLLAVLVLRSALDVVVPGGDPLLLRQGEGGCQRTRVRSRRVRGARPAADGAIALRAVGAVAVRVAQPMRRCAPSAGATAARTAASGGEAR